MTARPEVIHCAHCGVAHLASGPRIRTVRTCIECGERLPTSAEESTHERLARLSSENERLRADAHRVRQQRQALLVENERWRRWADLTWCRRLPRPLFRWWMRRRWLP